MLRFAILPPFYFNLDVCYDWRSARWGERAESSLESCALPGIPETQTDVKNPGDQNRAGSLVFLCGSLKADVVPVIFVLWNTATVLCKNPAQFSPVGNINGTPTGEEQVAWVKSRCLQTFPCWKASA